MLISALGELTIDGRPVPGTRVEAFVRALVEARGRPVSTAALTDAVWDGSPPADPAGALQALASRTRRLGLVVVAGPAGYRAAFDGAHVDLHEVHDLLARVQAAPHTGFAAEAVPELVAAAAHFGPDTRPEHRRLHAQVMAALTEAELAAGDAPSGLTTLRHLALGTPPDEPLVALLVRGLAAQGREAEALDVVERLRHDLAEQYGADPSPVVAAAHVALLRGELSPAQPAPSPAVAPAPAPTPAGPWRRTTTPLVGRDQDVHAVERALERHPLVTVVATGGTGKTRLAIEVTRRAAERGTVVRAVELAGVRSDAQVLPTLLNALGVAESVADIDRPTTRRLLSPEERLRTAASTLDGLLVVDNCEQVLSGVATAVAALLAAAGPGLRVLATSRAPLGVAGESVHPLPALGQADAVRLLRERATAVRPGLAWDETIAEELCRRLDHLPLALELAAARLRSMPLADVLGGLGDRFALLDDALRALPDQHAGLWAMVDWSWQLLSPAEQGALADLSVLPAPFTAPAAAAVAARPGVDPRRALAALVDQSLLSLEEDGAGPARYRMLETVRQYAEARLGASVERATALDRLVGWTVTEATTALGAIFGRDQVEALRRADLEQETFAAAVRWATDRDEGAALTVGAALMTSWTIRGLHREAVDMATSLLHATDARRRVRSVAVSGDTCRAAAGSTRVVADHVAIAALLGGVNGLVLGDMRLLALHTRIARRLLAAQSLSHPVESLVRAVQRPQGTDGDLAVPGPLLTDPDPALRAVGLLLSSTLRENIGDPARSLDDAVAAYTLFEQTGNRWGMGFTALAASRLPTRPGTPAVEVWLRRAAENLDLVGAHQDARSARLMLEVRRAIAGAPDARAALEAAAATTTDPDVRASAELGLAVIAADESRWPEAVAHADRALGAVRVTHGTMGQTEVLYEVVAAVIRLHAGLDTDALLADALERALPLHDVPALALVGFALATQANLSGDVDGGRELWAVCSRIGVNLSYLLGDDLADKLLAAPRGPEAEAALARARALSSGEALERLTALLTGVPQD
ncbi:BTAD domain-containing putative transcriptional regulator [Cellulomonas sp. P22]|uniref:BTAD domain-containing putative transcriptional regulator n=1 Tax=Cellulomonas sp. P22 TaxID=3373189 RepID=UPI0037982C2A